MDSGKIVFDDSTPREETVRPTAVKTKLFSTHANQSLPARLPLEERLLAAHRTRKTSTWSGRGGRRERYPKVVQKALAAFCTYGACNSVIIRFLNDHKGKSQAIADSEIIRAGTSLSHRDLVTFIRRRRCA